jgi:hypothetical protein
MSGDSHDNDPDAELPHPEDSPPPDFEAGPQEELDIFGPPDGDLTIFQGNGDAGSDAEDQLDPLARSMYLVLRDLPENDRRFVYRVLASRLSADQAENPERVELALHALRMCMLDIDRAPSRRSYDEWRKKQERPDDWPSATTIRNTFAGSWAKAMDALGVEPAPDVLARRLLDRGKSYSRRQMTDAVGACVEAIRPKRRLTWNRYRTWAGKELQKPDRALTRIPLSVKPFIDEFGSWGEAIAAAGFPELTAAAHPDQPGLHGPATAYTEERQLATLRQAACDLRGRTTRGPGTPPGGDRAPSMPAYAEWRKTKLDDLRDEGQVAFIPSAQTIQRTFGSWSSALHKAGLMTAEQARLARRQRARTVTDDEIVEWICIAVRELGRAPQSVHETLVADGPPLSEAARDGGAIDLGRGEYRRWREARLKRGPVDVVDELLSEEPAGGRPVSEALICERLGDWETALETARARLLETSAKPMTALRSEEEDVHD